MVAYKSFIIPSVKINIIVYFWQFWVISMAYCWANPLQYFKMEEN